MAALVIAARGSRLSRIQAETVGRMLEEAGFAVRYRWITTTGDRDRSATLSGVGVFVKEVQQALLRGEADLAVHSAKDLPTASPEGLEVVAFLERDTPWDLLIHREPLWRIGTSSARRKALLLEMFPHAEIHPLRGNVDTRLRKLREGETDGVVLSAAGLVRMGLWREGQTTVEGFRVQVLTPPEVVPAPAQGVIAVEMRADDPRKTQIRTLLNHSLTETAVRVERELLARAGAGCHAPFGCFVCSTAGGWEGFLFYHHAGGTLRLQETAPDPGELRRKLEEALRAHAV